MIRLGIAPIGWTNDDMPELGGDISFEQCISEMALAGYSGCEVGNKYPVHDRVYLKHMLDIRGISICNQWFSYEFSTKSFDEVKSNFIKQVDFLSFFGAKVVGGAETGNSIHGIYDKALNERKPTSDKIWKNLTSGLNKLGKISLNEPKKLSIITKEGTIEIKQLKIEGKKTISGNDYLNGNKKSEIKFI